MIKKYRMRSAFLVSIVPCLIAAAFSFVRGKENQAQLASDMMQGK